ncbi:MAG: class I SAM-dependent methyltransferase [Planctomycetes bacterium]|nr:class I SAM-dependent methyltransferase [Planctomycetota bacterium]
MSRTVLRVFRTYGLRGVAALLLYGVVLRWVRWLNRILPSGRRACPACGWEGFSFEPLFHETFFRRGARCPRCGSLERQRGLFLFLQGHLPARLAGERPFLQLGPDRAISDLLRGRSARAWGLDRRPFGDVRGDAARLPFRDGAFGTAIALHVLDYLDDPQAGLAELSRVVAPGGTLLLQVPRIPGGAPRVRCVIARQPIWRFGDGFEDDLRALGFEVSAENPGGAATPGDRARYGLESKPLLVCRRAP